MNLIIAAVRAAEDAEFDPDQVTPGPVGFAVMAVFALAVILLGVNLVRRLRRNAYRHEVRAQLEEEARANREAADDADAVDAQYDGGGSPAGDPAPPAGDGIGAGADPEPGPGVDPEPGADPDPRPERPGS